MASDTLSTAQYGLIGYPLGHSFSRRFFGEVIGVEYENFELPALTPATLYSVVLTHPALKGFNVTAPYKQAIMEFLDNISPEAAEAGAVNTVKVRRATDGRLLGLDGFNTDIEGFAESCRPFIEGLATGAGALILGTGGASRAVAVALKRLGIASAFVSRTKKSDGTILYSDIDKALVDANPLIVNATPAGTYPHTDTCPPFPYGLLSARNRCFDLVYNPAETEFMKRAAAQGAATKNGLEMLHLQALAAYKIWNLS